MTDFDWIAEQLQTLRTIDVYCDGGQHPRDRHDEVALATFESHSPASARPLGLRELWRITGDHARREIIDDPSMELPNGVHEVTELPERVAALVGVVQRYVVACDCGRNLPLNDLWLGDRRRETFRRLTTTADQLGSMGVSRIPLSTLGVILSK